MADDVLSPRKTGFRQRLLCIIQAQPYKYRNHTQSNLRNLQSYLRLNKPGASRIQFEASVVTSRCTFPWPTGGSGSAPRARKRGRKGLRNYDTAHAKLTRTYLESSPMNLGTAMMFLVRRGQDPLPAPFPSLTQAAAFTPNNSKKDSLGRST